MKEAALTLPYMTHIAATQLTDNCDVTHNVTH